MALGIAVDDFNITLTVTGGVVLLLGLSAGYVKNRLWVSDPALCVLVGMILGPLAGLASLDDLPFSADLLLVEAARTTLALAVMGAALRLPSDYMKRCWREMALVLGLGMPLMWLLASGVAWLVLPFSLLNCLLIGAILSPTDPVLAASILTGRTAESNIPVRLRHSLTSESGANDGLALLWVMLPILLMTRQPSEALRHWMLEVLAWEIGGGVVLGIIGGYVAGRIFQWANSKPDSDQQSTLTIAVALAITLLGALKLANTDGILGVFVAGVMLNGVIPEKEQRHEHVQEAMSRFFDLPIFVMFGLLLPLEGWRGLGWPGVVFAVAVIFVRRMPVWLVLAPWLKSIEGSREGLFAGWFGPMGISSIYYALVASDTTGWQPVWPVVSLAVFASLVAHGVSATPFAQRLPPPA